MLSIILILTRKANISYFFLELADWIPSSSCITAACKFISCFLLHPFSSCSALCGPVCMCLCLWFHVFLVLTFFTYNIHKEQTWLYFTKYNGMSYILKSWREDWITWKKLIYAILFSEIRENCLKSEILFKDLFLKEVGQCDIECSLVIVAFKDTIPSSKWLKIGRNCSLTWYSA